MNARDRYYEQQEKNRDEGMMWVLYIVFFLLILVVGYLWFRGYI